MSDATWVIIATNGKKYEIGKGDKIVELDGDPEELFIRMVEPHIDYPDGYGIEAWEGHALKIKISRINRDNVDIIFDDATGMPVDKDTGLPADLDYLPPIVVRGQLHRQRNKFLQPGTLGDQEESFGYCIIKSGRSKGNSHQYVFVTYSNRQRSSV